MRPPPWAETSFIARLHRRTPPLHLRGRNHPVCAGARSDQHRSLGIITHITARTAVVAGTEQGALPSLPKDRSLGHTPSMFSSRAGGCSEWSEPGCRLGLLILCWRRHWTAESYKDPNSSLQEPALQGFLSHFTHMSTQHVLHGSHCMMPTARAHRPPAWTSECARAPHAEASAPPLPVSDSIKKLFLLSAPP